MKEQIFKTNPAKHMLRFSKASPEALDSILDALHSEMDEAIAQKRFPTLEGAFQKLGFSSGMTTMLQ